MRKNSLGQNMAIVLVVVGMFAFIKMIGCAIEVNCEKPGCDKRAVTDSHYCAVHQSYDASSSSNGGISYSHKSSRSSSASSSESTNNNYSHKSNTGTNATYNNVRKKSTGTKKNNYNYNSYDDGYDDIYIDGDYDYDRYDRDRDYADGVDDAMDEEDGDW